tara:strand:- start:276 stop:449 length:174 start_codon:yes stop_codon:yes gene_type:complete
MMEQLERDLKEVRAEMEKGQSALKQCQVHIQDLSNQLLELTELMQASVVPVEGGSND